MSDVNKADAIDYASVRQAAFGSLSEIPFADLIGAPLKACVSAQNEAHKATLQAMKEMGLISDDKGGQVATSVGLEYLDHGRRRKLLVPLISLVPISFLQIDKVSIGFKAKINAAASLMQPSSLDLERTLASETKKKDDKDEKKGLDLEAEVGKIGKTLSGSSEDKDKKDGDASSTTNKPTSEQGDKGQGEDKAGDKPSEAKDSKDDKAGEKSLLERAKDVANSKWAKAAVQAGVLGFKLYSEHKKKKEEKKEAEYSSKKDSVAMRDSKYSIETTIDFDISASIADMPGGLLCVLEHLNGAIEAFDPLGELHVPEGAVEVGTPAPCSYRNAEGLYMPSMIKCEPSASVERVSTDTGVVFVFGQAGNYTITAGDKEKKVVVVGK